MSSDVPKIVAIAPTWLSASESASLSSNDVHLWLINIERYAANLPLFERILSPEEHARAAKFRQEGDRTRFITCRGILRHLLSRYAGLAPAAIRFSYNAYGKPALTAASGATPPLQFNLSHAGGLALYAFSTNHPIGVDLEQRRPLDVAALAKAFFSNGERAFLSQFSAAEQHIQFFQLWTCKEAYLKAIGLGLSRLERSEMAIAPDGSIYLKAFVNSSSEHSSQNSSWLIQPLMLANQFSAAFAVNMTGCNLHFYRLNSIQEFITTHSN